MSSLKFDFASPKTFGDWATYAGFDRTTGQIEPPAAPTQGVAPPQTMGEYAEQKFANVSNMMGAVAPAMAQLGQGNVMGAVGTMRGARNPAQPAAQPVAQQQQYDNTYDYTHGLDEEP